MSSTIGAPKYRALIRAFIIQSFTMVEKALGIRLHGSKQVERAYCRRLNVHIRFLMILRLERRKNSDHEEYE